MSRREFRAGGRTAPAISAEHAQRLYWALQAVSKRIDKASGSPRFDASEHAEIEAALADGGREGVTSRAAKRWNPKDDPLDNGDNLGESPDY